MNVTPQPSRGTGPFYRQGRTDDPYGLEDMVLARAPEYLAAMVAADEDLAAGRTRAATDVFVELDA